MTAAIIDAIGARILPSRRVLTISRESNHPDSLAERSDNKNCESV
jgi:hypothetical protein